MSARTRQSRLSIEELEAILAVTRALAAPFDLTTMLSEVVAAAKKVLGADRGSVWLHDPATDELVLEVATGIRPIRVPSGAGLVGACARERRIINVPDCYSDPRFDRSVDKASGYRTRCMLTLPLIDHKNALVGVMQVLNKNDGSTFDADDEALATALAAQCAVALQRVRMTGALIEGEKMRQALEMAREVQLSTLPATMPEVPGYDVAGASRPAELTGGDTFDLSLIDGRLLIVLGDATGHGIAPALSVTQMQAMLRIAFRLGTDLESAFLHVNNRLAETLPADRFITAFIGLLDPQTHRLRFISGGQGPILHHRAADDGCVRYRPTSFPLGAMPLAAAKAATEIEIQPGDTLVLLSDGFYEAERKDGEAFGEARVEAFVSAHRDESMRALLSRLTEAVDAFGQGAEQQDDMTAVLVRRQPARSTAQRSFRRTFDSLPAIVAFTEGAFAEQGIDPGLRGAIDFGIEELFTNMVKYGGSDADVRIAIDRVDGGVEVTLIDYDVAPFDVTQAPDADTGAPLDARTPGGLGLHLVRRLVDSITYDYSTERRQSRVRFRKLSGQKPAPVPEKGESNAGD
jgi:sigma-B regulation protein RsbU (phosphoserine phosphatase)